MIDYQLAGVADAEPLYRLLTTVLDADRAPAPELAALYRERWEIETALDKLKTHLRGPRIVLRSKTPELVRQECWGLMLAHFAIRSLMHDAARQRGDDPDRLSYLHAVRAVRRNIITHGAIPPQRRNSLRQHVLDELLDERVVSSRNRCTPRGVKRKMSGYPLRPRHAPTRRMDGPPTVRIV